MVLASDKPSLENSPLKIYYNFQRKTQNDQHNNMKINENINNYDIQQAKKKFKTHFKKNQLQSTTRNI